MYLTIPGLKWDWFWRRDNAGNAQNAPRQDVLSQSPSKLIQLPREIRHQIYITLFDSVILRPERALSGRYPHLPGAKKPAGQLAILQTCKQVNRETSPLWLRHVLFDLSGLFPKPQWLPIKYDGFSKLPETIPSQIRHLKIGAMHECSFCLASHDIGIRIPHGLGLDVLTIMAQVDDRDAVEQLIGFGLGWRVLHLFLVNAASLCFRGPYPPLDPDALTIPVRLQNSWRKLLLQRDGVNSGASLVLYQPSSPSYPSTAWSAMNPLTAELDEHPSFSVTEEEYCPVTPFEWNRMKPSHLIIVKRGRGADIGET